MTPTFDQSVVEDLLVDLLEQIDEREAQGPEAIVACTEIINMMADKCGVPREDALDFAASRLE